jgi:hypothetical protein
MIAWNNSKMAARLKSAGIEIILVPNDVEKYRSRVDSKPSQLPFVTEGNDEIFKTYALFSQSFEADGNCPKPCCPSTQNF